MRPVKHLPKIQTTANRGASAVEYGLMLAAVAAIVVATVFAMGALVQSAFSTTCSSIQSAASADPHCGSINSTRQGG